MADIQNISNFTFDILNPILTYFNRIGLIAELNSRRDAIHLILQVEAHELYLRGGFTAQEELLETNIKKLLLEMTISRNK